MIKVIGFDADDTLWHCEKFFTFTIEKFTRIVSQSTSREDLKQKLIEREIENIHHFGYGVKGFVLSMIETAIEVTDGKIDSSAINEIIQYGRQMLNDRIELLPNVKKVLKNLSKNYELWIITKGDLFDQENKIARSQLAEIFSQVHILSEKNTADYMKILNQSQIKPDEFLMVGNSLKSDIYPAVQTGASAVHIPYEDAFNYLEQIDPALLSNYHFLQANSFKELEAVIALIQARKS